ncbi:MAG: cyclic pyranopterin phosphate synthase [Lysobacterales bacterium]|jgi:cyclic pyranopterin phosphate synthase
MSTEILTDKLNRALSDLRISVIDRCNYRCTYCMPAHEYGANYRFLNKDEWLTFDEITRLTKLFTQLGVTKIRLTGGEPLLRPNLTELITQLNTIEAIEDLALTTNGAFLFQHAESLKKAGLKRLTVSLDSIDNDTFIALTGGKGILKDVKQGLREAERVGFTSIKLNTVVQKGVNEHTIMDLIEYFRDTPHILRFIEYMDVGTCNDWDKSEVVPSKDILHMISKKYPLKPSESNYYGEVAKRYTYEDNKGEIGFISSVSQPFCTECTRARLSTDGRIYTCLFTNQSTDLRTPLRNGATDVELLDLIRSIWEKRADRYSEIRAKLPKAAIPTDKVEMFHIGG